MNRKNVLIIGLGYLGGSVYEYLQYTGNYCMAGVDLGWFSNGLNDYILQPYDYETLSLPFYSHYDEIILFAGLSSVAMCKTQEETFRHNVVKFQSLLNKLNPKQRLIYASSGSVYGSVEARNKEDDPLPAPTNHYDASKQMIDALALTSGKRTVGLRLGTVNGAGVTTRTDLMMNKMIWEIEGGCISVYNAINYRAILGISDLTRAIEALIEGEEKQKIYNLSSFNTMIGALGKKVAKQCNVAYCNQGENSTYSFRLSTDKFQEDFSFQFEDDVDSILDTLFNTELTSNIRNHIPGLVTYI